MDATKRELYEEATALDIPGRSRMSKRELRAAIQRHRRGRREPTRDVTWAEVGEILNLRRAAGRQYDRAQRGRGARIFQERGKRVAAKAEGERAAIVKAHNAKMQELYDAGFDDEQIDSWVRELAERQWRAWQAHQRRVGAAAASSRAAMRR